MHRYKGQVYPPASGSYTVFTSTCPQGRGSYYEEIGKSCSFFGSWVQNEKMMTRPPASSMNGEHKEHNRQTYGNAYFSFPLGSSDGEHKEHVVSKLHSARENVDDSLRSKGSHSHKFEAGSDHSPHELS
jgi:hypothetical protein